MEERDLVVTSVRYLNDIRDGNTLYEVIFTEISSFKEEVMNRIAPVQQQNFAIGLPLLTNFLTLFYKPDNDESVPYRVGSKWKLAINKKGRLLLNEVRNNG